MSEFKLPAYRLPVNAMEAIYDSIGLIGEASQGTFEPQPHVPHLTLLRNSLYGGRVGIDVSTQYTALGERINAEAAEYTLPVKCIENTTRSFTRAAVLAIILDDPSGEYREEYLSIRSRIPERIRGRVDDNVPHITLGRIEAPFVTPRLIEAAEAVLPSAIDFGPLQFSSAIVKYHKQMKLQLTD